MSCHSCKNSIKNITTILFLLGITPFLFAQEASSNIASQSSYIKSKDLSELQKQARLYRSQGLEFQKAGNLESAMSLYQRAVELDPSYAVVYNDLGILYEVKGLIERAEQSYLQAIKIDPNFLSPYSNLALLYENKRQLDKAAHYWNKRIELGSSDDLWTQEAKKRLDDLTQVIPELRQRYIEEEIIKLNKEISEKQKIKELEELKEAQERLKLAKELYNNAQYKQAIDELNRVLSLNPQAQDVLAMMETAKAKLIEQQKKANIQKMQEHFQNGMRYYQQGNPQAAKEEFNKIIELTASPQKN